jgi:hypothetical protein
MALTAAISSLVMWPSTSALLAKTSRLAPARRWGGVVVGLSAQNRYNDADMGNHPPRTREGLSREGPLPSHPS